MKWVLFFLYILSSSSGILAHTVPELMTIEELLSDKQIASNYYDQLRMRFKNNSFEEILFSHDRIISSPRLSRENYNKMLTTLGVFLKNHPEEVPRFREGAHFPPFQIHPNGEIELLPEHALASWKNLGTRISQIQKTQKNFLIEHETALKDMVKKYMQSKDPAILYQMADLLIGLEVGPLRSEKLENWKYLPNYIQYIILEDIERQATHTGRQLGAPGKLLDSLLTYSSLGQSVERSSFFRKGITVLPMTRLEAAFKGIGPGECLRTSCNRYFDALFDDSIHLKILKDGQEVGFVGIYKTADLTTQKKLWFLETIQSPLLDTKLLRGLLRHLQQLAIEDDSLLAIPSQSFNSYNHKDIVTGLLSIPEIYQDCVFSSSFRNPDRLEVLKGFQSSEVCKLDQTLTEASGYKSLDFANGHEFNEGKVVIIHHLVDQPDWYLQQAYDLWVTKKHSPKNKDLVLSPLQRGELLKILVSGTAAKEAIFQLQQKSMKEGRIEEAQKLGELIYEVIPKEFQDKSFLRQYTHFLYGSQPLDEALSQKMKEELFLAANSWEDYLKILSLGPKNSPTFLFSTLNKFASQATVRQLVDIYEANEKSLPVESWKSALRKKIDGLLRSSPELASLKTAENFEDLSILFKKTSGVKPKTQWGHYQGNFFSKILADHMIHIIQQSDVNKLIQNSMDIVKMSGFLFGADINRVKISVMEKASTLEECRHLTYSNSVSLHESVIFLGSRSLSSAAQKLWSSFFLEGNFLDPSFFGFKGTSFDYFFSYDDQEERNNILNQAKAATKKDYVFKWRKIIKAKNILSRRAAIVLQYYIHFVRHLPMPQQREVLKQFSDSLPVLITEHIPEHKNLISVLKEWIAFLSGQQERKARKLLEQKFSTNLNPWKEDSNSTLGLIYECMVLLMSDK